jgi:hypothetical protein
MLSPMTTDVFYFIFSASGDVTFFRFEVFRGMSQLSNDVMIMMRIDICLDREPQVSFHLYTSILNGASSPCSFFFCDVVFKVCKYTNQSRGY